MNTTKRDLEAEVAERVEADLEALDIEEAFIASLDIPARYRDREADEIARFLDMSKTDWRCAQNDFYDALSKGREYEEIGDRLYDAREVQAIRDEIEAEIAEEEADDDD
jgi:hypothetical protein